MSLADVLQIASVHLLENRWEEAILVYTGLRRGVSEHTLAGCRHNTALCCELLGRVEEAVRLYSETIVRWPAYERPRMALSECLRRCGKADPSLLMGCGSLQSRCLQCSHLFAEQQDYNGNALSLYARLAAERLRGGARRTSHYAQCYYENFCNTEYYLEDHLPVIKSLRPRDPSLSTLLVSSAGYCHLTLVALQSMGRWAPALVRGVTVYCTDQASRHFLQRLCPEVRVVGLDVDEPPPTLASYQEATFNRVVHWKVAVVHAHLAQGETVFFCDSDVVFCGDPTPWLKGPLPRFQQDGTDLACTGVMHAGPDSADLFDPQWYSPDCGDQCTLNFLLHDRQLPFELLDPVLFANGERSSRGCVMKHYNYHIGPAKVGAMAEDGALEGCSLQERVCLATTLFRPRPHRNSGFAGPWLEQRYYQHWLAKGSQGSGSTYLPIYWTDVQVVSPQLVPQLQAFMDTLPRGRRYHTVCQHADGLGVTGGDLDLRVFGSGRSFGAAGDVLPLLKQEMPVPPPGGIRSERVCFAGNVSTANDPRGVRTRTLAAFPEAVRHYGPGWADLLARTTFSLCPRGRGPTSFRFSESLHLGAIPVVVWDGELLLPFPDLDYSSFAVCCHVDDLATLQLPWARVEAMQAAGRRVRHMFTYEYSNQHVDAALRGAARKATG